MIKSLLSGPTKQLYYLLYLILIVPLYFYNYVPSLDGGQHACTANVLNELLFHSSSNVSTFYQLTEYPVGYWVTHLLYSVYQALFTGNIAEKFLLTTYFLFFAYASWYLVSSYVKKPSWSIVLFIPFASHMFLMMGYYPFSFAIPMMFIVIGFFVKHIEHFERKQYILLSSLLLLLYFFHGIIYTVGLVIVFSITIWNLKKLKLKQLFFLAISALPSVLLMLGYVLWVSDISGTKTVSFPLTLGELIKNYFVGRHLVGFNHIKEFWPGLIVIISLFVTIILIVIEKVKNVKSIWLVIGTLLMLMYLFIPNLFLTGSLVDRLGLLSLLMLVIFVNSLENKHVLNRYLSLPMALIIIFFIFKRKEIHNTYLEKASEEISEIQELQPYITKNSIVYGINMSEGWMKGHYLCYLGDNRYNVVLRNPQLVGKHPVKWNKKVPYVFAGEKCVNRNGFFGTSLHTVKKYHEFLKPEFVDFIAVWEYSSFLKATDHPMRVILDKYYVLEQKTSKGRAALYRLKAKKKLTKRIGRMMNSEKWLEAIVQKATNNNNSIEQQMVYDAYSMGL